MQIHGRTLKDIFVPVYAWFLVGFTVFSVLFALINFPVNVLTMLKVYGYNFSLWWVAIIGIALVIILIVFGYYYFIKDVAKALTSYYNKNNPEIMRIDRRLETMERLLKDLAGKKE